MTPGATHPRGAAVRRPLEALNFFMADIQAGVGPFLGVFLLAHDWQSGWIGTVMTIGGIAGMIMTTPAGALIDATTRKRLYVVVPGLCTVAASAIILLSQSFWIVAASQIATAIAAAALGPAVAGITLASHGRPASTGRWAAIRPSIMPATWSARDCRACSDGSSAIPPCSPSPPCSACCRSPRC
jgi:MFS family permease